MRMCHLLNVAIETRSNSLALVRVSYSDKMNVEMTM